VKQFEDAQALVAHAREAFKGLQVAYGASLREKAVKPALLIQIKNLLENLRSALDYAAAGLHEKYGEPGCGHPKIYFPYALESQSAAAFRKSGRIEKCIPRLSASRPDIVRKLEAYQAFADPANAWLPRFMFLCNKNKHQRLDPQVRQEAKELRISSGGAVGMRVSEGSSVKLGRGASIRFGGGLVTTGEQTFDVDNPPVPIGPGSVESITWVDFRFASNSEPVLTLLTAAIDGVAGIVAELESL